VPANLTPVYREAEAAYRAATTAEEKRAALERMLATIPKHKGTEKLQAEIKRKLARLRQETERRANPKRRTVHVEPEGAAQVVLLGPPNAGKSSLLAALTHAEPGIADYPFTTTRPQPGMMRFEDVRIQLVDLPPVTADHMDPWLPNVVQMADAAVLVVDPSQPGTLDAAEAVSERMESVHLPLVGALPEDPDPRDMPLPTLVVVAKTDLVDPGDVEVIRELLGDRFPVVPFSVKGGREVQGFKVALWHLLGLIRVYTKKPGQKAERRDPFVLPEGSTVLDLAERIHQDLPAKLVSARVWGGRLDGQQVSKEFELRDRDLVQLNT